MNLNSILGIDNRIRFVSKITPDGDFLDYVFRKDLQILLDEDKKSKMARHVSILASSHRIVDNLLGPPEMTITLRGDYVSVLIYYDDYLYSISLDKCREYEAVSTKIITLLKKSE